MVGGQLTGGAPMNRITYEIVQHDGGWAYKADGVFSETFSTRDAARHAAERAARAQQLPGDTDGISWEDKDGRWHDKKTENNNHPKTENEKKKTNTKTSPFG